MHYLAVTDLEQEVMLGNFLKKNMFISTIWIYAFLSFYVTLSGIGPYHSFIGIDHNAKEGVIPLLTQGRYNICSLIKLVSSLSLLSSQLTVCLKFSSNFTSLAVVVAKQFTLLPWSCGSFRVDSELSPHPHPPLVWIFLTYTNDSEQALWETLH